MKLTKIQCDNFCNDPTHNPLTGRKIAHNKTTYNKIKKLCDEKKIKKISFSDSSNSVFPYEIPNQNIDNENKVVFDKLIYLLENKIGHLIEESFYDENTNQIGNISTIDTKSIASYTKGISNQNKKILISSMKKLWNKSMKNVLINIFEKNYDALDINTDIESIGITYDRFARILIKIAIPTYSYNCKIFCGTNDECPKFYDYLLTTFVRKKNIEKFNKLIMKTFSSNCRLI